MWTGGTIVSTLTVQQNHCSGLGTTSPDKIISCCGLRRPQKAKFSHKKVRKKRNMGGGNKWKHLLKKEQKQWEVFVFLCSLYPGSKTTNLGHLEEFGPLKMEKRGKKRCRY